MPVITNTDHEMQHPWPESTYVQGGGRGVVFREGKDAYRTAFVEAFPGGTFIRGEGETLAEAEDACWKKYVVWRDCADGSGEHGPYERRQYRNGAGFCTKCGIWMNRVLDPLPDEEEPEREKSLAERLFVDKDPRALKQVVDTMAIAEKLPAKDEPARSSYRREDWKHLGRAVAETRVALKMTRNVLGYAMKSSGKTVLRLEQGEIYGDPRTAPPGNYNSERYMLKRLPLLEMALEWDAGYATSILNAGPVVSPDP